MAQATATRQQPSSHYLTQAGLSAAFLRVLAALWPRLTAGDITRSEFRLQLYALTTKFAQSSAALAADDYMKRRTAEGIRSSFTVPHASAPSVEQFNSALNWSLADVATNPATAQSNLDGSMNRLVLNTGRQTIQDAVEQDRQARAWARETRPGCCSWCAMLASRGAVYSSAHAAGEDNQFHNNCHCVVVPVFGHYEPTADARKWHADWYALKRELGHTPSLNQWRQRFEGRPVDGLPPTQNVPQSAGNN